MGLETPRRNPTGGRGRSGEWTEPETVAEPEEAAPRPGPRVDQQDAGPRRRRRETETETEAEAQRDRDRRARRRNGDARQGVLQDLLLPALAEPAPAAAPGEAKAEGPGAEALGLVGPPGRNRTYVGGPGVAKVKGGGPSEYRVPSPGAAGG